jgi:hypothetical protein
MHNLPTAPPKWFKEKVAFAAELFGLELGLPAGRTDWTRIVLCRDEEGRRHRFRVVTRQTIEAAVYREVGP